MIAINTMSIWGQVGWVRACAMVLSVRNRINPTFARAIKKPESRKYVFFARRMKYSPEQEAVSARMSRMLIRKY